ncbi:MAG: hypothetical protein ACJ8DO_13405 [Microvirga sp.]
MIPLSPHLDDIDFDALLALARARLPALAPEWTDYNHHDPGITLVELLAWVADSQVYSLARNRLDERLAMARLLAAAPRGAIPAQGTVYPIVPPPAAQLIDLGTVLTPATTSAPRLETTHDVVLLPVELESIRTEGGGLAIDHTATNARARATFAAFGEPPLPGAELRIALKVADGATLSPAASILSLGFEIEGRGGKSTPAENELGRLTVSLRADGSEFDALEVVDTTAGMQRSGVMLLALPASAIADVRSLTILIRPQAPHALMPRLVRVAANALPVAQHATFRRRFPATARPGQIVQIEPQSLFRSDEAAEGRVWRLVDGPDALSVSVSDGQEWPAWQPGRLEEAGPEDNVYARDEQIDGSRIELRFGNGVNGRKPGLGATIEMTRLRLSCGSGGNVVSRLEWLLDGHRTRWTNREPIRGGKDAQDAGSTLAAVREILRSERILATSEQIKRAVDALPDAFGIERVEVEDGWERGRRSPRVAATRTLIVVRRGSGTETPAWRRSIARRLTPRIAIGERLLVEAPIYRDFRIEAEVTVAASRRAEEVVGAVQRDLAERFGVIKSARPAWPLGRDVDVTAIGGWIRRVAGVAGVLAVTLRDNSGRALDSLPVGRGELPRLIAPAKVAFAAGSARP